MTKVFIIINDSRWEKYKIDFAKIVNVAMTMALAHDSVDREISITLTDDSEIKKLNKKYRGIDKATNVLSFETGDAELLGDIFISFDTVMREDPDSFVAHTTHMVVHGVLHLIGYDHMNDSDANKMEALEVKILAKFGIKNPYDAGARGNAPCDGKGEIKGRVSTHPYMSSLRKYYLPLLTFLCGVAASFAFAPFYLWWLGLLGLGVSYYLIFAKQKSDESTDNRDQITDNANRCALTCVLCALSFGAGYAVAMFWWVLHSIFVVPELAAQFAVWTVPGVIGIAIAGGLIFGAPFWITKFTKTNDWRRPIIFAAAWTLVLWMREWFLSGFPWNPFANIAMPLPTLANSMALWGALGLTFVLVGLVAGIVELRQKKKNGFIPIIIFIPLLIGGGVYGYYNILMSAPDSAASPAIRIVQPASEQSAKLNRQVAEDNVRHMIKLSGDASPDIVVWPETAYPFTIPMDADGNAMVDFAPAKEIGVPVIAGANVLKVPESGEGKDLRFFNSMIIADADGTIRNIYSKSHLVPFGEYRPFGDIIPTPGQLTRGGGPEIIVIGDTKQAIRFAPAICYEIIFSDSLVPKNSSHLSPVTCHEQSPQAIVNITNDTWFGRTPGTYQHLDMARRAAIESGLPIVRANYSGISAFIAADGRIISSLPVGVADALDGTVSGAHMTPYRRIGRDWWMAIILGFAILCTLPFGRGRRAQSAERR